LEEPRKVFGFTRDDLLKEDPVVLRTILRERTHHTIEVFIYRICAGKMPVPPNFGETVEFLLDIWKERGLPLDSPDVKWAQEFLAYAKTLRAGGTVKFNTELPEPFTDEEMKTVKKLLYGRRSIRQFAAREVPDELIRRVLEAGLMAPQGCNVGATRFIVLKNPEDWKMVQSDIPLDHGVMIIVCQDMRVYHSVGFEKVFPQNIYYDAATVADHMLLMAHALGLGGVWLTHGDETRRRVRERFGLPETFVSRCHIHIGWPAEAPVKTSRPTLQESIVKWI